MDLQYLTALAADINSNPDLAADVAAGNNGNIMRYYNEEANPAVLAWTERTAAEMLEVYDFTELDNLTDKKQFQLSQVSALGTIDARKANVLAGMQEIFAGVGLANTRAALIALFKRNATRAEAVLSTAVPNTNGAKILVWEGQVTLDDIRTARAL